MAGRRPNRPVIVFGGLTTAGLNETGQAKHREDKTMTQITKSVTGVATDDAIQRFETALADAKPLSTQLAKLLDTADQNPDEWDSIMVTMQKLEASVRLADAQHRIVIDEIAYELVSDTAADSPTLADMTPADYSQWLRTGEGHGQIREGRIQHGADDAPALGGLADHRATETVYEIVGFGSLIGYFGREYIGADGDAHVLVRVADDAEFESDADPDAKRYAVRFEDDADADADPVPVAAADDEREASDGVLTAKQPKCVDGTWRGHDWQDIGERTDADGRTIGRDKCDKCNRERVSTIDPQFGWTRYQYTA